VSGLGVSTGVPTQRAALATLLGLTWRRLWRGRALWAAVAIAALPVGYTLAAAAPALATGGTTVTFLIELLLLAVLPPLFVAAAIGEELEDRTATYLWSRPLARWLIVASKLLALTPIVAGLLVAGWLIASRIGDGALPPARTALALAAGVTAAAMVSAGVALLAPRYAMALATSYLLFFDLPVGELPMSIRQLSLSHHTLTLAGLTDDGVRGALLGLALLGGGWLAAGLLRLRRLET
jgi:ABC-type transport system involved in multi-copper enzyme maturation permease subunit